MEHEPRSAANIRLSGNWGGHLPASPLSRYSALVFRVDRWSDRES